MNFVGWAARPLIQRLKIMQPSIPPLLLLAGLLCGLGACRPAPTGEPSAPSPAPGLTGAPSGLTGVVMSASDVSGQPDQPLAGQLLLALPLAKAGPLLGLSEAELTPERLRFLKASLPQKDPAMTLAVSDSAGRYTLLLDPVQTVLCLLESEQSPPDFPATTRGCGLTTVVEGQLRTVDISSGFGEILLLAR
jgi:hypothetical protein